MARFADIYVRLSVFDETTDALERQEEDLRGWAEKLGLTVRRVWRDAGVSGFKTGVDRAAFKNAVQALTNGDVSTLLVWKLDRLSRKGAGEVGTLMDDLQKSGAKIMFFKDSLDTSVKEHRLAIMLVSEQARQESDNTSTRVKSKNEALVKAGLPVLGRARFGYLSADPATGRVVNTVAHPEEAQVVKDIFRDYLAGATIDSLAKRLGWRRMRVRLTLANKAYAGYLKAGDAEYPASEAVERLVSLEDWTKVQARLNANSEAWRGYGKPGGQVVHLLSGIARCGICGDRMYFRNNYMCLKNISHPTIAGHILETAVDMALIHWYKNQDLYANLDPGVEALHDIEAEIGKLEERIQDVLSGLSEGLTMSQLLPHLKPLQEAQKAAQSRRDALLEQSLQARFVAQIAEWINANNSSLVQSLRIAGALGELGTDQHRELIRTLFDVTVNPGRGAERVSILPKRAR